MWACLVCLDDQRAQRAAAATERSRRLEASWERSCTGGTDSGVPLTVFPNFPYARLTNEPWCNRVAPKLLNIVQTYQADRPLLVLGDTGTGKTSAIVARQHGELERLRGEVRAGASRRIDFGYVTGFDLAGCRRRSRIGDESPLFEHAARAELCIIDELGFEPTAPDGEVIALLDHRHRRGVATVVLSGLTRDAFAARYGGAALRRLVQGGMLCDLHPAQRGQARVAG